MALRFIDSFDHYPTWGWTGKYSGHSDDPVIGPSYGRYGNGLYLENNDTMNKTFESRATWVTGFACKFLWAPPNGSIMDWYLSGTRQASLFINTSGQLNIRRGTGTIVGQSSLVTCDYNIWYYLEVKQTFDTSAGSVIVRVNGAEAINATGINNCATGSPNADTIRLWTDNMPVYYDDYYILDTSGSAPTNDFLGDCRVECLFPDGNGNSSQWVGSDADSTDNYLHVDETSPDSDTTYVESDTVGNKDTYTYSNLTSTSGNVFGVQSIPYWRKTDAGIRKAVTIARIGVTEVDSSAYSITDGYVFTPDLRETKPGGGAWTITDVNNAEFGFKVDT